jgi:uncharacterized protein YecE (DUF72 family)
LEGWVSATPPGFQFCIKAHQRITHIQRLKTSEFTDVFYKSIDPLRSSGRLGAVLFQLPPNLKCDVALLANFLVTLPRDVRCAFEFRNTSWLAEDVYGLLQKHGASLCQAESDQLEIPRVITAGFVYSRLRKSEYSPGERHEIADRVRGMLTTGHDLYMFFKHEDTPAGALYAEEILHATRQPALLTASSASRPA